MDEYVFCRFLKLVVCLFNQVESNKYRETEKYSGINWVIIWKVIAFNDIFSTVRFFRNLRCKKCVML